MSTHRNHKATHAPMVTVPVDCLTDRALLLLILHRTEGIEAKMTELSQAESDLDVAVSGVITRVTDLLGQAQAQAAALQTQVDTLTTTNEADKQALTDAATQINDLVSQAATAVGQVEGEVAKLNQVAQPPTPPPGPTPTPGPTPDPAPTPPPGPTPTPGPTPDPAPAQERHHRR